MTNQYETLDQERARLKAEAKEIKEFVTMCGYSDREPYEVVKMISDKTVEVRLMDAELDPEYKPNIVAGGFSGHCTNNGGKWIITKNENNPTMRIRWSEAKGQWQKAGKHISGAIRFAMADAPYKFYDYNF